VVQRALSLGVDMPIAQTVLALLDGQTTPQQAVRAPDGSRTHSGAGGFGVTIQGLEITMTADSVFSTAAVAELARLRCGRVR
jgi:hypothetical protein